MSVSDQILASATSTSVSDSPAPLHRTGVDHPLRAVSAPGPHSPNEQTSAAHLATILQRLETGNAPKQGMRNGELSSAESILTRTRVNPFVDMTQGQVTTREPSAAESLPSRKQVNPFEDVLQPQRMPTGESFAESLPDVEKVFLPEHE